jgi:hypothetical protein
MRKTDCRQDCLGKPNRLTRLRRLPVLKVTDDSEATTRHKRLAMGLWTKATTVDGQASHPPNAQKRARLVCKREGQKDRVFLLSSTTTVIGGGADSHIQLIDSRVSEQHGVIRRTGAVWSLEDLDSRGGLTVNGKRVEHHDLSDGDQIAVGPFLLEFQASTDDRGRSLNIDLSPGAWDTQTCHSTSANRALLSAIGSCHPQSPGSAQTRSRSDSRGTIESTWQRLDPPQAKASPYVPGRTVDDVRFSVTSPVLVAGMSHLVSVWAHLAAQREQVVAMAREEIAGNSIRVTGEGPVAISRGSVLTVRVSIAGLDVTPHEKTISWTGEVGKAGFAVTVPKQREPGTYPGTAIVLAAGLPVLRVDFVVEVANTERPATPVETAEHRYRRPFASYASEDRDAVLARIQGMLKVAPALDVFLDVVSLRSGEHWQERLRQEILERDVMYLFWSGAASRSEWVDWEWRCALHERGVDFIDPCPLVSPTEVRPPELLADRVHFNDWILAYMSWKATGGRTDAHGS